ncbi:MAG: hypothetical protein C4334_05150 [Pyrinomonas sp.]
MSALRSRFTPLERHARSDSASTQVIRATRLGVLSLLLLSQAIAQAPAPKPIPDETALRRHVQTLASEKFEGRRAGTPGAALAARYIAEEFARLGLRPCCATSHDLEQPAYRDYWQTFNLAGRGQLGQRNEMSFTDAEGATLDLRLNEDWVPLMWTASARVEEIPAVVVNGGIVAEELKRDDYAGLDLRGKAVILPSMVPEEADPHNPLARYAEPRWRATAARERGARAIIFVSSQTRLADDPLVRSEAEHAAGDAQLIAVVVSQAAARRLLAANGVRRTDVSLANEPNGAASRVRADGIRLTIQTEIVRRNLETANVIGIVEGADPALRAEAVLIGAHYDHLGLGGRGSLAPDQRAIHYGADDNASGTAALIELARIFTQQRPRRTFIFAAFGGEELGLLGSNHYVRNPVFPLAQTVAMLNMDMIGRLRQGRLTVGGVGSASEWRALVEEVNRRLTPMRSGGGAATQGIFNLTLNPDGFGPSDHASFYARRVPVLFFWTGTHEDYHRPSDTADKINYVGQTQIALFVAEIAREIDRLPQRPTYAITRGEPSGRTTGFRVYLGTIPNYAESDRGVRLEAVREGSPAARAGLKSGDLIVKLAGREVRNIYDYTNALSEMQPNVEYEVEVERDGRRLRLRITPEARRR